MRNTFTSAKAASSAAAPQQSYTEGTNTFYRAMARLAGQGHALRTTIEDIHVGACAVCTLDEGWESYTNAKAASI